MAQFQTNFQANLGQQGGGGTGLEGLTQGATALFSLLLQQKRSQDAMAFRREQSNEARVFRRQESERSAETQRELIDYRAAIDEAARAEQRQRDEMQAAAVVDGLADVERFILEAEGDKKRSPIQQHQGALWQTHPSLKYADPMERRDLILRMRPGLKDAEGKVTKAGEALVKQYEGNMGVDFLDEVREGQLLEDVLNHVRNTYKGNPEAMAAIAENAIGRVQQRYEDIPTRDKAIARYTQDIEEGTRLHAPTTSSVANLTGTADQIFGRRDIKTAGAGELEVGLSKPNLNDAEARTTIEGQQNLNRPFRVTAGMVAGLGVDALGEDREPLLMDILGQPRNVFTLNYQRDPEGMVTHIDVEVEGGPYHGSWADRLEQIINASPGNQQAFIGLALANGQTGEGVDLRKIGGQFRPAALEESPPSDETVPPDRQPFDDYINQGFESWQKKMQKLRGDDR